MQPEIERIRSGECGFEIVASSKGQYRETFYFDRSGELVRVSAHPSYASILTSEYGSLSTADRGVDKFSWDADGNLLIHGTGIHLKVKGSAYSIGLWRLTIGEDGLMSQEYHSNFGLEFPELVRTSARLLALSSRRLAESGTWPPAQECPLVSAALPAPRRPARGDVGHSAGARIAVLRTGPDQLGPFVDPGGSEPRDTECPTPLARRGQPA